MGASGLKSQKACRKTGMVYGPGMKEDLRPWLSRLWSRGCKNSSLWFLLHIHLAFFEWAAWNIWDQVTWYLCLCCAFSNFHFPCRPFCRPGLPPKHTPPLSTRPRERVLSCPLQKPPVSSPFLWNSIWAFTEVWTELVFLKRRHRQSKRKTPLEIFF